MTDVQLFDAYNGLNANQSDSDGSGTSDDTDIADVVANALKPLSDQIAGLQAKINSQEDLELENLAVLIGNSAKYPGLDSESAKQLGVEKLKELAANCAESFGVSPLVNMGQKDDTYSAPTDTPE